MFIAALLASALHHFAYFARDRERISEHSFTRTQALEGAQLIFAWNELETAKDTYDFSSIKSGVA